ncbi:MULTISPECIES: hypothetical protein [unclassified Leucobacter]|uniref:hypothetical protein n=1 Tax=unclassified Leucobacter TaxID=2621730 RepID=UPI000621D8DE|nr:hypothetical protein [Leucobacter sp. Ag1]KKI16392.1 hypothetical protein XM48_16505 [Leucobacter sp. Ag1]
MAIQEQLTVDVAAVAVDDDYRVELTQLRKVWSYSPEQARDLANELVNAADNAEAQLNAQVAEMGARMTAATIRTDLGEVVF